MSSITGKQDAVEEAKVLGDLQVRERERNTIAASVASLLLLKTRTSSFLVAICNNKHTLSGAIHVHCRSHQTTTASIALS